VGQRIKSKIVLRDRLQQALPKRDSKAKTAQLALPVMFLLAVWLASNPTANAFPSPKKNTFYQQSTPVAIKQDVLSPTVGLSITDKLAGGEAHAYRIPLQAGQYLRVIVKQQEIDIAIILYGPDRQQLGETDSATGARGTESASLVADSSGDYEIEVRSTDKGARSGGYELRIEELGAKTAEGENRIAAERAFAEGRRLRSQAKPEAWRKALESFNNALQLWQTLGDKNEQSNTLHFIGRTYRYLGDLKNTLENYNRALSIRRELKDRYAEAHTLNEIGLAHNELGDPQKALEYYDKALLIRQEIDDRRGQAITLNNIGLSNMYLSNQQKAIAYFSQALSVWQQEGDRSMEALTLNNLGGIHYKRGESQKALEYFNQSLLIRQELGNQRGQAQTLNNISLVYQDRGELQKALESYNQALPIWRAVGDHPGEANTLDNIGTIYTLLGDPQGGLDHHNQALLVRQQVNDQRGQANTLTHIGYAYSILEGPGKAMPYYEQALKLRKAVNDQWGEGYTLIKIGEAYAQLGDSQKALDHYYRALELLKIAEDRQEQADAFNKIAQAYNSLGDSNKALENYRQALELWQSIGDRRGAATTLYGIARVERDRGNFSEALKNSEAAVSIIETLRSKVASQQLRITYLASVRDYYDLDIDTRMRLRNSNPSEGHDARAFEASERARARSLVELLNEAYANISRKADAALLERERFLRQEIDAKEQARIQLLNGKHTGQQAVAAEKELSALIDKYQELLTEIKIKSPSYAALTQPQPLTLKEIQQQVLDPDTLLLEYSLGDDRSYLWAVTQTSINSFELPGRAELEAQAKLVYKLLTAHQEAAGETAQKYLARVAQADADYWPQAARLSQMLLGAVASQLGEKRLLVVAEGALQYIPFSALPAPTNETARMSAEKPEAGVGANSSSFMPHPLIIDHEIVNLPSAAVLAILRREVAGRKPAAKAIAVFADPVFEKDDYRIKSPKNKLIAQSAKQQSASGELSRALSLPRLPSTRREAQEIQAVVSAKDSFEALDFMANRKMATSPELAKYRIVHFATHGLLNNEHPELSGIVLSLFDEQGNQQNGFLRLNDIYNLNLPAELVVLSACSTGLGKEIRGEGLVGLTRGFMYAGAARVMASLWNVNDLATANLMKRFYKAVMTDGLPPASALRKAQVEMWKSQSWKAPYHWAAFVLQGEWK
jgi:CHAT domain-containing protein/Tfp pilus assembly protein PilF